MKNKIKHQTLILYLGITISITIITTTFINASPTMQKLKIQIANTILEIENLTIPNKKQ